MRLLHLVQQNHVVRTSADRLRELTALLVAHVAGRSAHQPRHRVLLHVLRHVDAHDVLLVVEQLQRQLLRQLRLAHSRRTQEQETTQRLALTRQTRTRAQNGVAHRFDGLVLADHLLRQPLRQLHQTVAVRGVQPVHGNARPVTHHVRDVAARHFLLQHARVLLLLDLRLLLLDGLLQLGQRVVLQIRHTRRVVVSLRDLDLVLRLRHLVLQTTQLVHRALLLLVTHHQRLQLLLHLLQLLLHLLQPRLARVVLLVLHRRLLNLQLQLLALQSVDLLRLAVQLHADVRTRLVHQVDRLVGQETVLDVPVRQLRSHHQRRVVDPHAVEPLVAVLQTSQNAHRVLHRRLAHIHLLESALESGVLLHVLLVLLQRRRADHTQLATRQHRLQQVSGVHGAVGLAGSQQQVHLIDEQDDLALAVLHLVHHRLQTLLELATVLGSGDQRSQIQRDQTHVKRLGNVALHDSVRQTFHDGGLSHSRLTDQHRVVLRSATENADHTTNLLVTTNHRIDLALLRLLHKILTVLVQRVVGAFGGVRRCARVASLLLDGVVQLLLRQTHALKERLHSCVTEQGAQNVVLCHTRVLLRSRIVLCNLQNLHQGSARIELIRKRTLLRQLFHLLVDFLLQKLHIHSRLLDHEVGEFLLRFQHGGNQMHI